MTKKRDINLAYIMAQFKSWLITIGRSHQFLIKERIYVLAYIIKRVYMILAILSQVQYLFINNNIDQDQFNILCNKDFETKKMPIINKIVYQFN